MNKFNFIRNNTHSAEEDIPYLIDKPKEIFKVE